MDTFVVRLWDAVEADHAVDPLRGTAHHVASGATTPFVGVDELLAFFVWAGRQRPRTSGNPEPRSAATT
jgi:hypothetical protein